MKTLFPVIMLVIVTIIGCDNLSNSNKITNTANEDSLVILTNLIASDSLSDNLFAKRATLYLQRGNIDPALRDIQTALKINPENPGLFILLSDVYLVLGQTENSIASLKKAFKLNQDSEVPFLKLSEVYLLLEDPKTALNYANEAISINRYNPESYYLKAMCLMENLDTNKAITNFRISANYDSTNYMTYMQLGAIYTSRNDTLSKSYFLKALEIVPGDERALFYLGLYYQEQRDLDKAIEIYSKIAAKYPDNKRAYYNMGYLYLVEFEDLENAKLMFESAISISPGYVEAVYNLGRTYEALGDYTSAREQYWRSLELLPNYPLAIQSLNRLDDIQIRGKK